MQYIFLDLEWNNAYSKIHHRFVNEIIEIGAVKLNENFIEITKREARRTYIDWSKFLYMKLHKIKVSAPNDVDISMVTEPNKRLIICCNYQSFII